MWSGLVTVVAIAVASNLDNAGVGIAYGVRKIHFSFWANFIIAIISGVCTWLAGVVGTTLTRYLPEQTTAWVGATVMILVGLWVFTEPWRSKRRKQAQETSQNVMQRILRDPTTADFDQSKTISLKEAAVLGIALALNAFAGGFDAGVVHIGVVVTAIAVAMMSFILLAASAWVGARYASRVFGSRATYIAGVLLILIGIHQIW